MSGSECPTYQGDYFKILTKATMSYLQNIFLGSRNSLLHCSLGEKSKLNMLKHAIMKEQKLSGAQGRTCRRGEKGKG